MKALAQILKTAAVSSLVAFGALHAEAGLAEYGTESQVGQSSAESTQESKSSFCAGKHNNTGCFVGVSLGLSPATSRLDLTPPTGTIITGQPIKESVTIPLSLDIGYQWYFAQNSGFRFRGYVGYENFSAKDLKAIVSAGGNGEFSLSSHALTYGLEARYLYDFIYGGDHTFGANIGFGVEGSSFFNAVTTPGQAGDYPQRTHDFANYTRFTWTSPVGLHYFYKSHHQILLSYAYRGYTDELQKGGTINQKVPARVSAFANHTFTLSYAYKF